MPQFDTQFFPSLIFWELISFGILCAVLYKFAFPPILAALDAREQKIRDSLEQAERHRAEAEQRLQDYDAKLRDAAREAEAVVADAKAKAQRLLEDNERRLRAEAKRMRDETTRELERERRKAAQELRKETANLAVAVAEQVLGRSLSDDDHRRLAQDALQAVADGNATGFVNTDGK